MAWHTVLTSNSSTSSCRAPGAISQSYHGCYCINRVGFPTSKATTYKWQLLFLHEPRVNFLYDFVRYGLEHCRVRKALVAFGWPCEAL
jgi:hypothetical protein